MYNSRPGVNIRAQVRSAREQKLVVWQGSSLAELLRFRDCVDLHELARELAREQKSVMWQGSRICSANIEWISELFYFLTLEKKKYSIFPELSSRAKIR